MQRQRGLKAENERLTQCVEDQATELQVTERRLSEALRHLRISRDYVRRLEPSINAHGAQASTPFQQMPPLAPRRDLQRLLHKPHRQFHQLNTQAPSSDMQAAGPVNHLIRIDTPADARAEPPAFYDRRFASDSTTIYQGDSESQVRMELELMRNYVAGLQGECDKWRAEAMDRGHEAVSRSFQDSVNEAVRREREKDMMVFRSLEADRERDAGAIKSLEAEVADLSMRLWLAESDKERATLMSSIGDELGPLRSDDGDDEGDDARDGEGDDEVQEGGHDEGHERDG